MQDETIIQPENESIINYRSWWGKLVAFIAVANLVAVLFNFSYLPLRDIYLRELPAIVQIYDPVKNIEPHPDTSNYLQTVNLLAEEIKTTGLQSTATKQFLSELRQQSSDLLAENPFSVANKFGTFAKLKRRMEYQMNTLSAKEAFSQFWTPEYFASVTPDETLTFFDRKISPLLEVNYFREVDENGQFRDNFWLIDIWFGAFFALEFLIRTFWISPQRPKISWLDSMLRRWYDCFMFLPLWRWLRIVPVAVKLHKSGLINLERILAQITHEPAAYLADRTSVFLLVRLINQTQEAVKTGAAARALLNPQEYVQVSEINKIDAISDRLLELSIYKVLPKVQPDVEVLIRHTLRETFQQSEFYQGLKKLPGFEVLPVEVTEQLADYLAQSVYEILVQSYSDIEGRELFENLTLNFKRALKQELQQEDTQSELQLLLTELLEELKINYVQNSKEEDPTVTLSEVEKMRSAELSNI